MKKLFAIVFIAAGLFSSSFAQETQSEFKPNGKPLGLIFTNFHTASSDGETTPAFENTRAYLGYEYTFSEKWYAKVVYDVGNPDDGGGYELSAFLKNAYMEYSSGKFETTFGMISTTKFKVSEKLWGNRYMLKSYQDEYKFNSSADLGVNFDYQLADFISVDFSVINGEGYKKIQGDDLLRPGVGTTIEPLEGLLARVFVDTYGKDVKQQSLATLLAYSTDNFVLAGEYNYQSNYKMVDGHDRFGTSFYSWYKPSDKIKLFARYDGLNSKKLEGASEGWNSSKDGSLIVAGLEFAPVKGVKLTPNFRNWNPSVEGVKSTTFLYLNCELKF